MLALCLYHDSTCKTYISTILSTMFVPCYYHVSTELVLYHTCKA